MLSSAVKNFLLLSKSTKLADEYYEELVSSLSLFVSGAMATEGGRDICCQFLTSHLEESADFPLERKVIFPYWSFEFNR